MFRHELTPTWLANATMLAGYRPLDLTRPFRLAWFGCRASFNPAVAAAVHPGAQVVAWDPDPTGIVKVRHLRDEAGLSNLLVHEQPSPPSPQDGPFDLMVVEGLVDGIDDHRRAQLLDATVRLLRPGGVLCVTYRTVVGWGEFVPVVRLLRHVVNRSSRDVETSVADAMTLLDIFKEREVDYVTARPMVRAWVDALLESSVDDVISEYVQRDLQPASHAQIAQAVDGLGCSFIGSALLDDGLPEGVPDELAKIVSDAPSSLLRESLADIVLRRPFRADLFTLGGATEAPRAHTQHIKVLPLTGFGTDPRGVDRPPPWPHEETEGTEVAMEQIESCRRTTDELWPDRSVKERPQVLRRALQTGHVHPAEAGEPDPAAVAASARLTEILNGTATPKPHRHIVTPLVGSAVPSDLELADAHLRFLRGDS